MIRDVLGRISFSPDGKQIAFVRRSPKTGSTLHIADADGANERVVLRRTFDQGFAETTSWSPDGKWIAAAHRDLTGGLHAVPLVVSPDGKTVRTIARDRWYFIARIGWLPNMTGLVFAGMKEGGRSQLWLLSWPDGSARRLTSDLNWYDTFSVAADGKSIMATRGEARGGVWRIEANGSVNAVTDDGLREFPGRGFAVAANGRMYFDSDIAGTSDIWTMDADGTKTRITSLPAAEFAPALSRDGQTLYYQYETGQQIELHAVSPTGSGRRIVATFPAIDATTIMAPDGRAMLISSGSKKTLVPTNGGAHTTLALPPGHAFVGFSPDGRRIAGFFRLLEEGQRQQIAIFPTTGDKPLRVFDRKETQVTAPGMVWTSDGRHLAYVDIEGGIENVWFQPVDGGAAKAVTSFRDARVIEGISHGPERSLYIVRVAYSADIVRISDFR